MMDRSAYASRVLDGILIVVPTASTPETSLAAAISDFAPITAAVVIALVVLFRDRLPFRVRVIPKFMVNTIKTLRYLHSGRVGDYVAWLTLGVGALGALFAFLLT
jgi:multicomponent Na+:H+ antiporter subunit D